MEMKIDLRQEVDLSQFEMGEYEVEDMPAITKEIRRLAEKFFNDVLEENFSCSLIPMEDDATLQLVVDLNLSHKKETWWQISVDHILNECFDEAFLNGKDKTFLKKMRDLR